MTEVERAQQFARLLDADLRGGALGDAMLDAAHRSEGIERDRVPRHQAVEEVAQRRERLVFGRRGALELAHILTGQARSDLAEFEALVLAPGQKPHHRAAVGAPGVGIVEGGLEKLLGGEDRVGASPNQISGIPSAATWSWPRFTATIAVIPPPHPHLFCGKFLQR